jgi:hypothetical protein
MVMIVPNVLPGHAPIAGTASPQRTVPTVPELESPVVTKDRPAPSPAPPQETPKRPWAPRWVPGVTSVAVLTWLAVTPFAVLIPRITAFSPFTIRGAFVPLAVGGALLALT